MPGTESQASTPSSPPPAPRPRPPAAFLDESYHYEPGSTSRVPLYVLAAVVIDADEVSNARSSLAAVMPTGTYHSTDLYHQGRIEVIHDMLEYVRDNVGWNVVAVQMPFPGHADLARRQCLAALLRELDSMKVGLVVPDSRLQPGAFDPQVLDQKTSKSSVVCGGGGRLTVTWSLRHAADAAEPMLWMPDAIAWAVRRDLAIGEHEHFEVVRSVTNVIVLDDFGRRLWADSNKAGPPWR